MVLLKLFGMKMCGGVFLLFLCFVCNAQVGIYVGVGASAIDLEDSSEYKYILIDSTSVWNIAKPGKEILFLPANEPHLGHYAIITDSTGYYSENIRSSFNFRLILGSGVKTYWISFEHKYDFEENMDGGIIETSYDNGTSWINMSEDTVIRNNLTDRHNFYDSTDTISAFNNHKGFTGTQPEMELVYVEFEAKDWMFEKSLLLRFTIGTDSHSGNNEGWMLDAFRFGGTMYTALHGTARNSGEISIFPNPAKDVVNINCSSISLSKIRILNSNGLLIRQYTGPSVNPIDISDIPPGIYILVMEDFTHEKWVFKLIKL